MTSSPPGGSDESSLRLAPGPRLVDELAARFTTAGKPREEWRVGLEHEKIGVLGGGAPLSWPGLSRILSRFQGVGYAPIHEGDHVIALERGGERITLEPGGQLELSGLPHTSLAATVAEVTRHLAELAEASVPDGVHWLGLGFRPWGRLEDIDWVPKGRYAVMRKVLPARGKHAHDMMKRTATVQANLDYADEADATLKFRAAMGVSSIVTALYASSPIVEGRDTGFASFRARAWLETDPDRCGLLPFAFDDGPLFSRYVEWALDVPLLFLYRRGVYSDAEGITFRRFVEEGIGGERPTLDDWDTHLSTLFTEARLKRYIEVRGADSGSRELVLALPALWKGLLYHDDATRAAVALTAHLRYQERLALRENVPLGGLFTRVPPRGQLLDWARELVAIARAGLLAVAPDEVTALAPLEEIAATGRAPAERIRELWSETGGDPALVIPALSL